MTVPERNHTKWLKNFDQGDIKKLVEFTRRSQPTITKAIRRKEADLDLILKIDEFFAIKIKSLQQK
jgi:hypothetical protein